MASGCGISVNRGASAQSAGRKQSDLLCRAVRSANWGAYDELDELDLEFAQFVWGSDDPAVKVVDHIKVLERGRPQVQPGNGFFKGK